MNTKYNFKRCGGWRPHLLYVPIIVNTLNFIETNSITYRLDFLYRVLVNYIDDLDVDWTLHGILSVDLSLSTYSYL